MTTHIGPVSAERICSRCLNCQNQYGNAYEPGDTAYCLAVSDLVSGNHAQCVTLRIPGVSDERCGVDGVLFVAGALS